VPQGNKEFTRVNVSGFLAIQFAALDALDQIPECGKR